MKINIELRKTQKGFCVIDVDAFEETSSGMSIRRVSWQSKFEKTERECLANLPMILNALWEQPGKFKSRK